jgi:hypothetical protein
MGASGHRDRGAGGRVVDDLLEVVVRVGRPRRDRQGQDGEGQEEVSARRGQGSRTIAAANSATVN